jgi:hypothetical protein
MRMDMAADLRDQLLEIAASNLTATERAGRYYRIAWEAVERLEARSTNFDVCVDAVKWQQKPLDCQGIEIEGKGKIEIRECEIEGGGVDIRGFSPGRVLENGNSRIGWKTNL